MAEKGMVGDGVAGGGTARRGVRTRRRVVIVVVIGVLLILVAPFLGPSLDGETGQFILWQLRVPRVLMAILVGSTLATVGAVYQTLLANPLAAPSTVGTTAGATLGALVAVLFLPAAGWAGLPVVAVAAFGGALFVTFLLTTLAQNGRVSVNDVLLLGVAISLAAGAVSAGLQYVADQTSLAVAIRWSLGHLPQVGYDGILFLVPWVAVCLGILLRQTRALESWVAGEEVAHAQGVDVVRLRTIGLGVGALGVSAVVAWCGPIAFVGLIVPHIVRRAFGSSRRVLIPASAFSGAVFLVACDTSARLLFPGRELPVGVLTAAIGAPLLVYLVSRRRGV